MYTDNSGDLKKKPKQSKTKQKQPGKWGDHTIYVNQIWQKSKSLQSVEINGWEEWGQPLRNPLNEELWIPTRP